VTPDGRVPVSDSVGGGAAGGGDRKPPARSAVKVAWSAEVIDGAGEPVQSRVSIRPVAAGGTCNTGVVTTATDGLVGEWHPLLVACTS
jgi:hypothetical protein